MTKSLKFLAAAFVASVAFQSLSMTQAEAAPAGMQDGQRFAASRPFQSQSQAKPDQSIEADAAKALQSLYDTSADASAMGQKATAVLVFPEVKKFGLLLGVSFGEGVLFKDGQPAGHYSTKGGSWGLQAGAQHFGYALFFMSQDAVDYLDRSKGWEIGAAPSIVIADKGRAAKLSSTTLNSDAHAVIFDQHGLMAGIGLEGSKISALDR